MKAMTNLEILDRMEEIIRGMDDSDIVCVHNEYCQGNHYDDIIFPMGELDEVLDGYSPSDIASLVRSSDFNPNCRFFTFGVYLVSFDYPEEEAFITDIAAFCVDNDEDFGMDEIREYLDLIADLEEAEEELEELVDEMNDSTSGMSFDEGQEYYQEYYADDIQELQARIEKLKEEIAEI